MLFTEQKDLDAVSAGCSALCVIQGRGFHRDQKALHCPEYSAFKSHCSGAGSPSSLLLASIEGNPEPWRKPPVIPAAFVAFNYIQSPGAEHLPPDLPVAANETDGELTPWRAACLCTLSMRFALIPKRDGFGYFESPLSSRSKMS